MTTNVDTYCGIYCGACSVLAHGETGHRDGFIGCLKEVPDSEMRCSGCKSDSVYAGCRTCKLRDCATQRGLEHCVECKDYPCSAYRAWQRASRLLPHLGECPGNLESVRRNGAESWLAAQQKRWSCPQCGTSFSWYATECRQCGRSLAKEAYAMKGLRRLLGNWILPAVYKRGKSRAGR